MGKTPPKEEAGGSPRKKAAGVDDPTLITASAPSPTGKTPPKGEESPRKKAPRLDDAALATVPVASELNPTGEAPPKDKAEGSLPKRSRSPRNKGANDEKRCKCNHVITNNAIEEWLQFLYDKDSWSCSSCLLEGNKGIVKVRPEKSNLLICVTCYSHLCCGVGSIAYPFGHSRAHGLKEKHWLAVLYCDPERGYCFKCNAEVPMPVKFGEGDNEYGLQLIRDIVSQKLLQALVPSVAQAEAELNPKVEMMGKVQAESRPSGFGVYLADKWPSYESRSSNVQGYAIRGIPNRGNTCYMSAVLQCLFVLGKLRERMLALDHSKGPLAQVLMELFVEATTSGDVLNPDDVLKCVRKHKPKFKVGTMEDSHELLTVLREIWNESEEIYNKQSDAPTVIDSIFRFEMAQLLSCNKCGHSSLTSDSFWDLKLDFPSKWHPTKSAASPQTSESARCRKRQIVVPLFPSDGRNLGKMQRVSESDFSPVIGSDVIVKETHKPLEVDSTQVQRISQSKVVPQSALQIPEGNSVDSLIEDSISIEDLLLLFSEENQVEWYCPNCAKDHEEPRASQSKNGEQIVGSGNEDDIGDTIKIHRFTMLPHVLTLHLNRTSHLKTLLVDNTAGIKISAHVRFMEYLDVERFMDPSSVDKGSTLYHLSGVVEHIGEGSLKSGHYIAYVRARRFGNQQEGGICSSSWFCADDREIRQVTLEQVLSSGAYILFYERVDNQEICGINTLLKGEVEGSPLKRSRSPQKKSPPLQDKGPAAAVPLPTVPELEGAGRASDEKQRKCNHVITDSAIEELIPMPVKFGEGNNEVGLQEIRDIVVGQKLLAPLPSIGQTEAEVNPKKVEMTDKVQAESHPSGFGVVQIYLIVPKVDGQHQTAVFKLMNPMLWSSSEDSIFGQSGLDQMLTTDPNNVILYLLNSDGFLQPIGLEMSMDGQESTANITLMIDPVKQVAVLTAGNSINIYSVISTIHSSANEPVVGYFDHISSVSQVFGGTTVCYKGNIGNAKFYPLSIEFKRDFITNQLIGEGTYGTVYRCSRGDTQFAVKKMNSLSSTTLCPEVASMVRLSGTDHIVQIYAAWSEEVVPGFSIVYIAMKLFKRNLEDYLASRTETDLPKSTRIFTEVMSGVESIHRAGIIHRDLKPMNILLDNNDHVSITDFGIAKINPNPTAEVSYTGNQMYGTRLYGDPVLNSPYRQHDWKVDIYSCGIMYFEMHLLGIAQRRKCTRKFCDKYKYGMKNKKYNIWNSSLWKNWGGDKEIMKLMVTTQCRPNSSYFLQKLQGIAETTEAKVALE